MENPNGVERTIKFRAQRNHSARQIQRRRSEMSSGEPKAWKIVQTEHKRFKSLALPGS